MSRWAERVSPERSEILQIAKVESSHFLICHFNETKVPALRIAIRTRPISTRHQPQLSLRRKRREIHPLEARLFNAALGSEIIHAMTNPKPFRFTLFRAQDGLQQVGVNPAPTRYRQCKKIP
jgi:hypothetical protein